MYGLKATNIKTGNVQTNWSKLVREYTGFKGDFECADVISGTAQAPNVERKPINYSCGKINNQRNSDQV